MGQIYMRLAITQQLLIVFGVAVVFGGCSYSLRQYVVACAYCRCGQAFGSYAGYAARERVELTLILHSLEELWR